jgi:hypothetical protein
VTLSTLLVAASFQPLRTRIQGAVDRRFYRRRYDAERVASLFSSRLRGQIDLDALHRELMGVIDDTVQPPTRRCGCARDRAAPRRAAPPGWGVLVAAPAATAATARQGDQRDDHDQGDQACSDP